MITKKQLAIFEIFTRKPFAEYTRKEIKKASKEKSNHALALAINILKKESVIKEKKIGRSGILTINLENDLTFYYLALCNNNKIPAPAKQSLQLLQKEIIEETPFFSIVIFGSYAISQQKKESDLDLAIFIEHEEKQKKIEALVNSAKLKSILEMDIHVIPMKEMLEMLTNNDENLGKQIARKHLAVYNHEIFYEILNRGIKYGFRI